MTIFCLFVSIKKHPEGRFFTEMALLDIFKKKKIKEDRFARKQKEKTEAKKEIEKKEEPKPKTQKKISGFSANVLISPHITEKATALGEKNAYVFKIKPRANKIMVKQAIRETYRVLPEKVNIVYKPKKQRIFRSRKGVSPGLKKAVVYLKKGEKIEIS